jgi:hypothetical protein
MSSFLFWDVMQCRLVVSYRCFRTTSQSHLQGDGLIGCPKTQLTTNLNCITSQKGKILKHVVPPPNHDVYSRTGKPSWIQMLLVVDILITDQLLCTCKVSYEIITRRAYHTVCMCTSHMTLRETWNLLLYITVCICNDKCDYRDSSTELLELQHSAQHSLEVTNKWCYLSVSHAALLTI